MAFRKTCIQVVNISSDGLARLRRQLLCHEFGMTYIRKIHVF